MTRISVIDSVLCSRHSPKYYTLINLSKSSYQAYEKGCIIILILNNNFKWFSIFNSFFNGSAVQNLPAMQETWV